MKQAYFVALLVLDDGRKHAQDYSAEEAFESKPSLSRGYWQQCAIEWLTTRGSSTLCRAFDLVAALILSGSMTG